MNTLVQLFAFGSSSSTVVICFRKSDSCIPGWDPRRLNTAFGLDKMTWRLTANPLWEVFKKSTKRDFKILVYFSFSYNLDHIKSNFICYMPGPSSQSWKGALPVLQSQEEKQTLQYSVLGAFTEVYTGGEGICKKSSLDNKGWMLQAAISQKASHPTFDAQGITKT